MTHREAPVEQARITFERNYKASIDELWALWTTKEGFESWWGPEGFRVEVHELDLRQGGALIYDMIACREDQIAAMKEAGMPISHATRGTFTHIEPMQRLEITHVIDFIDGVEAYSNRAEVTFTEVGVHVRMVVTVDAHHNEHWTRLATAGWESQLTKLPEALASHGA